MNRYIVNVHCDACDRLLDGVQGTAEVRGSYLRCKGSLQLNAWVPEKGRHAFIYMGPPAQDFSFCGVKCLEDFMSARRSQLLSIVAEKL